MVYAPYNVLYHDYIIVLFSVGENTLDKSLSKRRFSKNTHKNKVSATSSFSRTMVTLAPTSTDPIGNE